MPIPPGRPFVTHAGRILGTSRQPIHFARRSCVGNFRLGRKADRSGKWAGDRFRLLAAVQRGGPNGRFGVTGIESQQRFSRGLFMDGRRVGLSGQCPATAVASASAQRRRRPAARGGCPRDPVASCNGERAGGGLRRRPLDLQILPKCKSFQMARNHLFELGNIGVRVAGDAQPQGAIFDGEFTFSHGKAYPPPIGAELNRHFVAEMLA